MFGLSQLRLGIYIAAAALIGYLVWREHSLTRKLAVSNHEKAQLTSTLESERAARAHERKISEAASNDYQNRLQRLETDRAATPVRSVRLCKPARTDLPSASTASLGTDARASGEQPPEAGSDIEVSRDIGPDLYALADQADERAAQCNALISWIRSR